VPGGIAGRKAVKDRDIPLKTYDDPSEAYLKTQHLEKRDWENGKIQDVWFQTITDEGLVQLTLF
jgi:hypothetical protein